MHHDELDRMDKSGTLLLAMPTAQGVLRFPVHQAPSGISHAAVWPGIPLSPWDLNPPSQTGIFERLLEKLQATISADIRGIDLDWQTRHLIVPSSTQHAFFLARLIAPTIRLHEQAASEFQLLTMPELLKQCTSSDAKKAYLRAWQVLMGAADDIISIGGSDPFRDHTKRGL